MSLIQPDICSTRLRFYWFSTERFSRGQVENRQKKYWD
jgi:hypothetical protein